MKVAYSIVKRCTGELGGNASGGAIYGELTIGSMQKVIDAAIKYCKLGKGSLFIDVGSGLGKPNFHVAQYPGVAASVGIEFHPDRLRLSLLNLQKVMKAAKNEGVVGDGDKLKTNIFFINGDIAKAVTLNPFTHVYMFDVGFPPQLLIDIAEIFNNSQSPYLICYHRPKLIIEEFGFKVELLHKIPTNLSGSRECHQCYFYERRIDSDSQPAAIASTAAVPCDPLFENSLVSISHGSQENPHASVKQTLDSFLTSPTQPAAAAAPASVNPPVSRAVTYLSQW